MLGGILVGIAAVLDLIIQMVFIVVLASVIISWIGADPMNPIVRIIHSITEPMYKPFRKLIKIGGPIDWAPMIIIFIMVFLQVGIVPSIRSKGLEMQGSPSTKMQPYTP